MAGALESNHTSIALKSILKGLHVATTGRKAERAARLAAHLAKNPELQSQPWAAAALTKVGNTFRNIPEPKWQHGGHGICAPTGYDAEVATRTARLEQQSPHGQEASGLPEVDTIQTPLDNRSDDDDDDDSEDDDDIDFDAVFDDLTDRPDDDYVDRNLVNSVLITPSPSPVAV